MFCGIRRALAFLPTSSGEFLHLLREEIERPNRKPEPLRFPGEGSRIRKIFRLVGKLRTHERAVTFLCLANGFSRQEGFDMEIGSFDRLPIDF